MAVNDEIETQFDSGLQATTASLNFGFLGLVEDLDGLSLGLDTMALLVLETNLALTQSIQSLGQFSDMLDKALPHLKSWQAVGAGTGQSVAVAGSNGYVPAPGAGLTTSPTTAEGAVKTAYISAIQNDAENRRLRNSGFSAAGVGQANHESDDLRRAIPGTSDLGNLNFIYNLQRVFKNPVEAMQAAHSLLQGGVIANSTSGESEIGIDESGFETAKLDKLSDKIFDKKTQRVNQAVAATLNNGLADFVLANPQISDAEFVKMANGAGQPVIDQITSPALFASIAPIIAALKGPQVAPALAAIKQVFDPAHLSQSAVAALQRLGVKPGGALYTANPAAWLEDVLVPALKSHGYSTPGQQGAFLQTLLKGSHFLPALQGVLAHLEAIEDYHQNYDAVAANPANSAGYISTHNMALRVNGLTESVDAFLATLGQAATSQAIKGLGYITNFVNEVNEFNKAHPDLAVGEMDALYAGVSAGTLVAIAKAAKIIAKGVKYVSEKGGKEAEEAGEKAAAGEVEATGLSEVAATTGLTDAEAATALAALPALTVATGGTDLLALGAFAVLALAANEIMQHPQQVMRAIEGAHPVHSPAEDRFYLYDGHDLHNDAYYSYGASGSSPFILPVTATEEQDRIYNVWVMNPDDIHGGMARSFARHLSVQTGPTGHNAALTPPLPSGSFL